MGGLKLPELIHHEPYQNEGKLVISNATMVKDSQIYKRTGHVQVYVITGINYCAYSIRV